MEIGRQGVAGNGYTSRVWKGDEIVKMADISNTGIGHFIYPSPFPSPLRGEDGGEGRGKNERIFQGSDA
jgi:hypothetical protein